MDEGAEQEKSHSIDWPKGFKDGLCPDCHCNRFLRGPEGAGSVNFKCAGCGATFNSVGPFGIQRLTRGKTPAPDLNAIQDELALWHARNFPNSSPENMLIGTMEELGELAHANLKSRELGKDLTAKERDAIGDIVVFLMEYCNMREFCMADIIRETWEDVRQRDYTKERQAT